MLSPRGFQTTVHEPNAAREAISSGPQRRFVSDEKKHIYEKFLDLVQGWGAYLLSRTASIVDYRWRVANNNRFYPKILPLSYCEG